MSELAQSTAGQVGETEIKLHDGETINTEGTSHLSHLDYPSQDNNQTSRAGNEGICKQTGALHMANDEAASLLRRLYIGHIITQGAFQVVHGLLERIHEMHISKSCTQQQILFQGNI